MSFRCAFAVLNPAEETKEWPLSVCSPGQTQARITSPMQVDVEPSKERAEAYILVNTTGDPDFNANNGAGLVDIREVTDSGEWVDISTGIPELSLSLTVCYSSPAVESLPTEASRAAKEHYEPNSDWSSNSLSYNTSAIRLQLCATRNQPSRDSRGVFTFTNKTSWSGPEVRFIGNFLSYSAFQDHWGFNTTVLMCTGCSAHTSLPLANRQHAALFNDILQDTLNPALALQSHFTVLFGITYYDHQVQFDLIGPATVVRSVDVLRPVGKLFFMIVLLVCVVHLVTVVVINLLFCVRCKHVQLGNAWSVVAHLWGSETEVWLKRANGQKDETVKKWMAALGEGSVPVGIKQVDGRLQIVRKRV
jgi:hypothetical protein